MEAIRVENLSKTYTNKMKALDNLSLNVKQGEVFTLLGKNGAGKSSLINILTTLIKPTSGKVTIFDKNLRKEKKAIRKDISCVAQEISIDNHLSLSENMMFQGRLYKMEKEDIRKQMDKLVINFGLKEYMEKNVSSYSGGIKRRLDIAMRLISKPKIIFLDEPTVGMDIESRLSMWNMIEQIKTELNTTVFLTTHYLEEADKLSDTICIIKNGHEIIQDTPTNLKQYISRQMIRIECGTNIVAKHVEEIISKKEYVKNVFCKENIALVLVRDCEKAYMKLLKIMIDENIAHSSISVVNPSIDDVFLALTQERSM